MSTPVAEAFFDFACPYSFLAYNRVREATMRTQSELEWRPVAAAALEAALEEPTAALTQAQRNYRLKDLKSWASYCGLFVERDYDSEVDSTAALKGTFLAIEHGVANQYVKAVFEACWCDNKDIADIKLLTDIATEAGLEAKEFAEWLDKTVVADALERNAKEFVEAGGFVLPGFIVADELILGNERMPLVELALGQASDIEFVLPGQHDIWSGMDEQAEVENG